jgi:hypothetical protein
MALAKTPQTLISNTTITTSTPAVSALSVDLSGAIDFAIGYTISFSASAISTGYARIELYADPTGANPSFSIGSYDDPVDSYDIQVDAGRTVNGVVQMNRSGKYAKVRVVNSSGQSITGVNIYAIVQAQA